jgi:hypothetical protein
MCNVIQCHAASLNVQEVLHNLSEKWMHIDIDTFYKITKQFY